MDEKIIQACKKQNREAQRVCTLVNVDHKSHFISRHTTTLSLLTNTIY